jgi:uncharacterized surface protein with fasciclin (FAS1) repeats
MRTPHHGLFLSLFLLLCLATGHAQSAAQKPSETLYTLMAALKATDLLTALEDKGSFTVFAPSDAAFNNMGDGEIRQLLKPENKQLLRSLMAYHIVAGKFTAARILRALCEGEGAATFTTVQGEELLATIEGTDIVLTDCSGNQARIISADTARQNMVFHRIDKVVLPQPL